MAKTEQPERRLGRIVARAQASIIRRFAPACAIVNRSMEVLYLSGPIDDYLQLPIGELTPNLIAMSRPGLANTLRSIIDRAIEGSEPVVEGGVRIKRGERYCSVRVVAEPLPEFSNDLLLVRFEEESTKRVRIVDAEPRDYRGPDRPQAIDESEIVIRQLEAELRGTKEELQATIEELETSNEEFRAANEEVTSINEKLQTVNRQLEQKVAELESTTNDLTNLLASTDVATIVLDRQYRLRRFNPAATRHLPVIETDVGRPVRDFAWNFTDERLLSDAEIVLQGLTPSESEVQDHEQKWYLRRILPYRSEDDRIDGVVITFTDISPQKSYQTSLEALAEQLEERVTTRTTQLRKASQALQASESRFRALLDWAPDAMIVASCDGEILDVDRQTEQLFGYDREYLVGQPVEALIPERFRDQHRQLRNEYFRDPQERPMGAALELAALRKDGNEVPVEIQLSPVEIDGETLVIAALRGMTE